MFHALNYTVLAVAAISLLLVGMAVPLGWSVFNRLSRNVNDHEVILDDQNEGYMRVRLGFAAAQVIGALPMLGGGLENWSTLWWVAGGLVFSTAMAVIGLLIADRAVFGRKRVALNDLPAECLAVAQVRFAFLLFVGIVTAGSLLGDSDLDLIPSLVSTFILLVSALVAGIVGVRLLAPVLSGVNLRKRVLDGSMAAARTYTGHLLFMAIVLAMAAEGLLVSLWQALVSTGIAAGMALGGGVVMSKLVDRFILTGRHTMRSIHTEERPVAAGMAAGVMVLSGFVVGLIAPALALFLV